MSTTQNDIQDDPPSAPGTRIDIVSDAICPWCYIGKRHLIGALAILAEEGLHFSIRWNPFQLNPDMAEEGVARSAYRTAKFGSAERAAELDANVTQAAAAAGLSFHLDRIARTPNTIDAHRLIWLAGRNHVQDALTDALFAAYFTQGADIGDRAVLAAIAGQVGLDPAQVRGLLDTDAMVDETRAADRAAREAGVNGVPSFFLDGYALFSGAMAASQMAEAFRRGNAILRERAAAAAE